jgi:hypothetical protein
MGIRLRWGDILVDGTLLGFGIALVLILTFFELLGSALRLTAEKRGHDASGHENRIAHILTSTFGLLALLIGFTFSIALNRYDTRRADVVLEANAIGTAHYRAGFVEPKNGAKLQKTLQAFAVHRLAYGKAGLGERKRLESISGHHRIEIGNAGKLLQPVAQSPLGALIVTSITDVQDLSVQREANLNARIPWTVFLVLIGISILAAGMMGFAYPLSGRLRQYSSILLFVLMTSTIIVILDLDRPARGSITVDQNPMLRLVADIKNNN